MSCSHVKPSLVVVLDAADCRVGTPTSQPNYAGIRSRSRDATLEARRDKPARMEPVWSGNNQFIDREVMPFLRGG
jgi:hypothetical protein